MVVRRESSRGKRSPLKEQPLRQAGQSLWGAHDRAAMRATIGAVAICMWIPIVILEWAGWYFSLPRTPGKITFVAAVFACIGSFVILREMRRIGRIRLGIEGEIAVGQRLDQERPEGYRVLHDLIEVGKGGSQFNIDHVLIGPGGVFVIETKTRSKPAARDATISYVGRGVSVDGGPTDTAPVDQAEANARSVRDILEEVTGRRGVPVKGVVLYPGWFVKQKCSSPRVWVLSPRALPKWLENEPPRLSSEDVALYWTRLKERMLSRETAPK